MNTLQPSTDIDTANFADPFSMWHDRMAEFYDVVREDDCPESFRVRFRAWNLGTVLLTSAEISAQTFLRDRNQVSHDQLDHYGLFAQGEGERFSHANGKVTRIQTGDLQFFDMAQEESVVASAGNSGTLYLPRHLVDDVIPDAASHHGMVLRDGIARILAGYILGTGTHFVDVPLSAVPSVAAASVQLALGCLVGALSDEGDRTGATHQANLRRQIERYVDVHLGNASLSAETIQIQFGLSRSALYRLFSAHRGVGRYIKLRRLSSIRRILVEQRDPRSLAELASDFGFQSSGHFSREFRRQFGCAPRDVRTYGVLNVQKPDGAPDRIAGLLKSLHSERNLVLAV